MLFLCSPCQVLTCALSISTSELPPKVNIPFPPSSPHAPSYSFRSPVTYFLQPSCYFYSCSLVWFLALRTPPTHVQHACPSPDTGTGVSILEGSGSLHHSCSKLRSKIGCALNGYTVHLLFFPFSALRELAANRLTCLTL